MAIKPRRYKNSNNDVYSLADVNVKKDNGSIFDFGTIENEFVSDNIMYIYCVPLERGIALKAFIDSFKLNFSKKIEKVKKNDSYRDKIKEYASDLSYEISLNIPAYSIEESKNNLAKITDLQRLLAPLTNFDNSGNNPIGVSKLFPSKVSYFSVWFKNLISSGLFYDGYKRPENLTNTDMLNHGFLCLIDEVNYQPDLEKGFFDSDNYLFPKNIKLNLKLQFRVALGGSALTRLARTQLKILPKAIPFFSYNSNGHYSRKDSGLFPFGVGTVSGFTENIGILEHMRSVDSYLGGLVFETDELNTLDTLPEGNYDKTRIFISTGIQKDEYPESTKYSSQNNTRRRYVCFKGFIDSFDRSVSMNYSTNDDKVKVLGSSTVDLSKDSKLDELNFNLSFSVPSNTILEAKKNCAKIGVLLRMSMKRADSNTASATAEEELKKIQNGSGKVKVYVPHMIENDKASKYVNSFNSMYSNSVSLFIKNFSVDIDAEKGFFDDPSGKLWPKSFKVTLAFDTDSPNRLIKNYILDNQRSPSNYRMLIGEGEDPEYDARKFPFSRETSKTSLIIRR